MRCDKFGTLVAGRERLGEHNIVGVNDMAEEKKADVAVEMSRGEAIAYLTRKKLEVSEENIQKCMREGKIHGDPHVSLSGW